MITLNMKVINEYSWCDRKKRRIMMGQQQFYLGWAPHICGCMQRTALQAPTTSVAGVGGFFLIIFQYALCILYTILDGLQPCRSVIATPQKIEGQPKQLSFTDYFSMFLGVRYFGEFATDKFNKFQFWSRQPYIGFAFTSISSSFVERY